MSRKLNCICDVATLTPEFGKSQKALYSLYTIAQMTKSRKIRDLVGNPEGKSKLERPGLTRVNYNEVGLQEAGWGS